MIYIYIYIFNCYGKISSISKQNVSNYIQNRGQNCILSNILYICLYWSLNVYQDSKKQYYA